MTAPNRVPAFARDEQGRGHGLSVIFFLIEQPLPRLVGVLALVSGIVTWCFDGGLVSFGVLLVTLPLALAAPFAIAIVYGSFRDSGERLDWQRYLMWRSPADAQKWELRKIPMAVLYEAYMSEALDFIGDVRETLLLRNRLFRFCFTWHDLAFYLRDFLRQNVSHSQVADRREVAPVYDRGNDFYHWFLGDSMVYTCALFRDPAESLDEAQVRKMDMICQATQMRAGDTHLDIGSGWGGLVVHAAKHYGTTGLGVTLAREQAAWALQHAQQNGVADRVRMVVDDYRNIPAEQFDKITCVEMAEHVGIKNFQKFMRQVAGLLKDDGVFYLQIAGLRRPWQYEDLVWGLFMAKYIFPAADASCPLAFVIGNAERAGFEVHRVENCGAHYSVTIRKWYDNWMRNREAIIGAYGQRWYRMWAMFLGWSTLIAAQGSSTVFMITMTKNTKNDRDSVSTDESSRVPFSRIGRWIGPKPIATQQ